MRLGPRHSPLKAWLAVAGDRGPGPRPLAVVSADWPGSGLAPTCRNTDTHNLTKRASQTPSRCSSSRLLLCSLQWCTSYRERQCLGSMVFPQSFFFGGAGRAEALIGAPVSAPSSASSRRHDEQCWAWAESIHGSTGRPRPRPPRVGPSVASGAIHDPNTLAQ